MNLKNRHFLTLKDYSKEEIKYLLDLAHQLKADKKCGKNWTTFIREKCMFDF